VVAGVADHSGYRSDPLGRLSRTSAYVTATSYGAMPEVEAAVRRVRRAHVPVTGHSERGIAYRASSPELAAWVHNTLVESFLTANQAYGARVLSHHEADRYVAEQVSIGRLLGAEPIPDTAVGVRSWVSDHPVIAPTAAMADTVRFVLSPPLDPTVKAVYRVLADAAIATIPPRVASILGVTARPSALGAGRTITAALRWALGASPRWRMALLRAGAPIDESRFKQKVPFEELR